MDQRRARRAGTAGAVLCAAAVALAGCSSGSTSSAAARATTTTTTKPGTTTTTSPAPSTTSTTVPSALVGLEPMLLTAADLPSGWTSTGVHSGSPTNPKISSSGPSCLQGVANVEAGRVSLVATFTNATSKDQAQESLIQLSGTAQAAGLYGQFTAALSHCNKVTDTIAPGVTLTISTLSVPGAPTPSAGYTATATQAGHPGGSDALVGYKGSTIWAVGLSGPGTPDTATLAQIAAAAVHKIRG